MKQGTCHLAVTLLHLAQHTQPWVGPQGRAGAAWPCSGRLRGAGALGKLSFSSNCGLRCFRQQLRELDHGFKLSHSWMLSKSCSWYWSPLFWSCFRLRRCLTCWSCFLMAQVQVSINLTALWQLSVLNVFIFYISLLLGAAFSLFSFFF